MFGLPMSHAHPKILSDSLWEYINSGHTEKVLVSIAVAVPQEILLYGKFVGTTWIDGVPFYAIPLTSEQEAERKRIIIDAREFLIDLVGIGSVIDPTSDPHVNRIEPKTVYYLVLEPTNIKKIIESPLFRSVNILGGYPESFKPTV